MAVANTALLLSSQNEGIVRSSPRVLCLDFDQFGLGLAEYLPPISETTHGWLPLLRKIQNANDNHEVEDLIIDVLANKLSTLAYQPIANLRLFVARPNNEKEEDISSFLLANENIKGTPSDTKRKYQFLSAQLRKHFDYVLIDARPGFEDLRVATTIFDADAIALMFRPSRAELVASKRMLSDYFEMRLRPEPMAILDRQFYPILPVMTLSSPSSDSHLDKLRRDAQRELFFWQTLPDSQVASAHHYRAEGPSEFCDVPFDSGRNSADHWRSKLEISKNYARFVPRSYHAVTLAIRRLNPLLDPTGALSFEAEHLARGEYGTAIRFRTAAIRIAHDTDQLWIDLWNNYRDVWDDDAEVRRAIWQLAHDINALEAPNQRSATSTIFGLLCLSEVLVHTDRDAEAKSIAQLWDAAICNFSDISEITADAVIARLRRFRTKRGKGIVVETVPSFAECSIASACSRARMVVDAVNANNGTVPMRLIRQLHSAVKSLAGAGDPREQVAPNARIWQLRTAIPGAARAEALAALGLEAAYSFDIPLALDAFRAALNESGPLTEEIRSNYLRVLALVESRTSLEVELRDTFNSPVSERDKVHAQLKVCDVEHIEVLLERLAKTGELDHKHLMAATFAYARVGRAKDAYSMLLRHEQITFANIESSALWEALGWLTEKTVISTLVNRWTRTILTENPAFLPKPFDIRLLLLFVVDPEALQVWLNRKVERSMVPFWRLSLDTFQNIFASDPTPPAEAVVSRMLERLGLLSLVRSIAAEHVKQRAKSQSQSDSLRWLRNAERMLDESVEKTNSMERITSASGESRELYSMPTHAGIADVAKEILGELRPILEGTKVAQLLRSTKPM